MKAPTPHSAPSRCRVTCIKNSRAPWRVYFTAERKGKVRREHRSFSTEEKARTFAAETEATIAEHGIRFGTLPPEVRRAYQAYLVAESELAAKGVNLPDFEEFVKNAINALDREADSLMLTVAEGIERFLESRKGRLKTATYDSLRLRLRRFAKSLGDRPIQSISAHDFETWWAGLPRERKPKGLNDGQLSPVGLSAFSKNHSRAALSSLFRHALTHEWITTNPIAAVKLEEVEPSEAAKPLVHSPERVVVIMRAAQTYRPEILPALALQLFAGLRVKDAAKIELSDLLAAGTTSGSYALPGSMTGGKQRRIQVTDALLAWLHTQSRSIGIAWEGRQHVLTTRIREVLAISGTEPSINSLRYTYLRYRLAKTGDALALMEEGGIRLGLVQILSQLPATSEDTEKFFSILPTTTN